MKNTIGWLWIAGLAAVIACIAAGCPGGTADSGSDSPEPMSHKTAFEYFRDEKITAGINMGNTLDAVNSWTDMDNPVSIETIWGNPPANQALFNGYKAQGFDIVRIPVTWMGHIGPAPDYKIENKWLKRVAAVAGYANNAGLKVIINMHNDGYHEHYGWLMIDSVESDPAITEKFEKVWANIAGHFVNYGDWLMFEGFNEIHWGEWGHGTAGDYRIINDWNQKFTDAVRGTGGNNARRYLCYNGYNTSYRISDPVSPFALPADTADGRQVVGFHYYEPFDFVYLTTTVHWGTPEEKAAIDAVFGAFKSKFTDNNIPVIISENGPFRYVPYAGNPEYSAGNVPIAQHNRLDYIDYFYRAARENGIVPMYWEGSYEPGAGAEGDTTLFNRTTGQPNSDESAEVIRHMIDAVQ